ncbi:Ig-like domain-containing protein [Rarobacter incanus]|nr:Ig-like domain-containing protein [Rarobacter incanus]
MTTSFRARKSPALRRVAAAVAGALLVGALGAGVPTGAAADSPTPTTSSTVDFDYFADVFPALADQRGSHVFESVTIERLKYILRFKEGNFAILIGDPTDAKLQAKIGLINQAAKAADVKKIYVFNPRIDGAKLNIFDWSELETQLGGDGLTYWEDEGPAATTGGTLLSLLNGDNPEPQFVRDEDGKVTAPYLFVANKDRKNGQDQDDRIVASLSDSQGAAVLATANAQDAYKAQVTSVLASAPLSVNSQFDFYKDEVNRRHLDRYTDATKYGAQILDDADNQDGWRIESLTYPETIDLLTNPLYADSDVPLLFGGTWCHNTRAVIKTVNETAQAANVSTVYNLDFSLFSTSNGRANYDHIRTSGQPVLADGKLVAPGHLYGDLFNKYLDGAVAEYAADGEEGASPNFYYPGGDVSGEVKSARRLQVPALLVYNKNHKDAQGNAQPVVDQAIRYNDNGTYTEYMSEWWYVAGRDLPNTADTTLQGTLAPGGNRLGSQRAFAREAVDEYRRVLGSLTTAAAASNVSVAESDSAISALPVGATTTLSVTVTAPTYSSYISLNTAGQDDALVDGTGAPLGKVIVSNQDGDVIAGPVQLPRATGSVSIDVPARSASDIGSVWTVSYLGHGYAIAPASTPITIGKTATVTLNELPQVSYEQEAQITAQVTAGATGTATITGLPGQPLTATISEGAVAFPLASGIAAGSYPVKVTYSGDSEYASAQSETKTLVIAKAKPVVTVTAAAYAYGKAGASAVTVTTAKKTPATGNVTLTVAGNTLSGKLNSAGAVTFALPANLAVKTQSVTVAYAGDANIAAASSTASVTVTKGKVTKVGAKVTKTPTSKKKGKVRVTVSTAKGLAAASGKVTVTAKKGKKSITVKGTVKSQRVSLTLPKLAKGKWKITAKYAGNGTYSSASSAKVTVKIKK